MIQSIERALNLRPGELRRGLPISAYLFLVVASYVTGKVARDSLFLSRFRAVQLPYADIATALAVGVVIAVVIRLGRRFSLRELLLGSLVLFTSNCLLFWALTLFYPADWLYPVIYVWVGVFGVLAPAQAWTLANYVLTTREAGRVFALVAGGAIAGGIFGGLFAKVIAKAFGTDSLLIAMGVLLAVCPLLVLLTWRQHRLAGVDTELAGPGESPPQNLLENMRLVLVSPYIRAIAALIWVSSFVTAVIGWQFKAVAREFISGKDQLAMFFGDFTFYGGMLALLVQLLVGSRFLRRFGIGVALLALPVGLMATSAFMLLSGTLLAAILLRGTDWVWRYSIDKSTVELLYLPLSTRVKIQVKWFVDTVIWRMGDGLAGLTVLVFATYLGLTARQMSWVSLALLGGWMVSAWAARRQYVATLTENMRKHRLEADRAAGAVLDRSTVEVLAENLSASDPKEVLYALNLLEAGRQRASHPAIRALLSHPAAEVREKAIAILAAAGDKSVLPQIEELLRDSSLNVRTEALLYLTRYVQVDPLQRIQQLGDFADFSIRSAMAAFLARPGGAQNLDASRALLASMVYEGGSLGKRTRMEAARLLGLLPDEFGPSLAHLLDDADPDVVREAIRSVGKLQKFQLVPALLARLADPLLTTDSQEALAGFGDSLVTRLGERLADPRVSVEVRQHIPAVLAEIGTQTASEMLVEHLLEPNTTVRGRVLAALNTLHRTHPELKRDTPVLETVLAAEILGHYRSYQILERLQSESDETLVGTVSDSMKRELERIFRLLELLFPRYDFSSAYIALQSKSVSVHDNALEFIDNVLRTQLRKILVPLLDGQVTMTERVSIADRMTSARIESSEQAAAALVSSDDPWLRSCGAYAIGILGLTSLESALDGCLEHPDPLLRETARHAKLRLHAAHGVRAQGLPAKT